MINLFYIASAIAVISTVMVITRKNGVHALLYLIVSLLAVAVIFYTLGAPFVAALEVIIYAGAIIVLLIFVTMMLNLGKEGVQEEKRIMRPLSWVGPLLLSLILIAELIYLMTMQEGSAIQVGKVISPQEVGQSLFTTYVVVVELAAMLLVAGIIGAYHLGKRRKSAIHRYFEEPSSNKEDK